MPSIIVSEQVQYGVVTRPKDKDSRAVPILDSLPVAAGRAPA
jgi:hypothetical protein